MNNKNKTHVPMTMPNLSGNEFEYLTKAFNSTWISSIGEYIDAFETNFSTFCNTEYAISLSNGTVALQIALDTLGIKEGDEVIVPDLTFAATINAVLHQNATPVIVDVEENSWCIDPLEIKKAITKKTKAIIPVHLYGQVCDMGSIMKIAKEFNLFVIEDCAEAHGAKWKNKKVGSIGHIGCFSFYGNKIITTGEGGMCVTNDEKLDQKMRVLRDHGMNKNKRYWHDYIGYNFRMTNLQAAIGVAQLERIDFFLKQRLEIENIYKTALNDVAIIKFQKNNLHDRTKVVWFVNILVKRNRDLYLNKMKNINIESRPFFYSLSKMPIYSSYTFSNKISQKLSSLGITLPTHDMVDDYIVNCIANIFKQ